MGTVPENERVAELRRLGVSSPLVQLSMGQVVHELFRDTCLGPPYYSYHGAGAPDGPLLVPLWDSSDSVIALWERADGLEFIEFSIEAVDTYRTLARTEQGFWACQFDFFYECDATLESLFQAAEAVGFRSLERHLSARETAASSLGTFEAHWDWLQQLVASIDGDAKNT